MDHCLMQTIQRIANLPFREESSKLSPLTVRNNGGGSISGCFFGDILKFCSPLAYTSIHYRSIGRRVTKTTLRYGLSGRATFRLKSCRRDVDKTAKSEQQTDCLLMQPVSIKIQHHTSPSKIC